MPQPANRRLATEQFVADAAATKVNSSAYTAGLAGKQDVATLAADAAAHVTDGSALDVALRAASVAAVAADGTFTRVKDRPIAFTQVGGSTLAADNTPAWNALMDLWDGPTGGGELVIPPGVYNFATQPADIPGGVLVSGTGFGYSDPTVAQPAKQSVLKATATMPRFITLGTYGSGGQSIAQYTGASIENLVVDGSDLADDAVQTQGRRGEIRNCQVYWGAVNAVHIQGQNNYIRGGVFAQNNKGDVVRISSGGDHKVLGAQLRQPSTTGAALRVINVNNVADVLISHCHMWSGGNGVGRAAEGLIVLDGNGSAQGIRHVNILGNIIEGIIGPEIVIKLHASLARGVTITGNTFFNLDATVAATYPVVQVVGAGTMGTFLFGSNMVDQNDDQKMYKSLVDFGSTLGSSARISITDNVGTYVAALVTGATQPTRPYLRGNLIRTSTASFASDASGRATLSGTGAQTAFTIAHGLVGAPVSVRVVPGSAAAATPFYVTSDATNITVTFITAPATGSNNVVLNWQAEM